MRSEVFISLLTELYIFLHYPAIYKHSASTEPLAGRAVARL